jgi:hypothetical protein
MKTQTILRKIFHWTLVLIVYLSLTSCPSTKDDTTPAEEHCISDNAITSRLEMDQNNYHSTYYAWHEGDYVSLEYSKTDMSGICPDKSILVGGAAYLELNQVKPIQVIVKVTWGNEFNSQELTVDWNIAGSTKAYNFSTTLDLSSYYLTGGAADLSMYIYFKFVSSGDNTADQNYFKSVFHSFNLMASYYPY